MIIITVMRKVLNKNCYIREFLNLPVFHQLQVARLIQAVVNSVPPNADVHVEINQNPRNFEPHIEIQHMHQQPASTSANTSSNGSSPEQGKFCE